MADPELGDQPLMAPLLDELHELAQNASFPLSHSSITREVVAVHEREFLHEKLYGLVVPAFVRQFPARQEALEQLLSRLHGLQTLLQIRLRDPSQSLLVALLHGPFSNDKRKERKVLTKSEVLVAVDHNVARERVRESRRFSSLPPRLAATGGAADLSSFDTPWIPTLFFVFFYILWSLAIENFKLEKR